MLHHWAALVWGRTFTVGYRAQPLVQPEEFDPERAAWAMRFIHATARSPQSLAGQPRWSLFRGQHHTVAGLTCLADLLSGTSLRDAEGNAVHLFAGLVCQDPAAVPPSRDLELFRPLLRYLLDRWDEPETPAAQRTGRCPYTLRVASQPLPAAPRALNQEPDQVLIAPPAAGADLWDAAAALPGIGSVCLDLASMEDARSGPFKNATAAGVIEELLIDRVPVPTVPRPTRRREHLLHHLRNSSEAELRETVLPALPPAPTADAAEPAPPELPQPPGTYARPRRSRPSGG